MKAPALAKKSTANQRNEHNVDLKKGLHSVAKDEGIATLFLMHGLTQKSNITADQVSSSQLQLSGTHCRPSVAVSFEQGSRLIFSGWPFTDFSSEKWELFKRLNWTELNGNEQFRIMLNFSTTNFSSRLASPLWWISTLGMSSYQTRRTVGIECNRVF